MILWQFLWCFFQFYWSLIETNNFWNSSKNRNIGIFFSQCRSWFHSKIWACLTRKYGNRTMIICDIYNKDQNDSQRIFFWSKTFWPLSGVGGKLRLISDSQIFSGISVTDVKVLPNNGWKPVSSWTVEDEELASEIFVQDWTGGFWCRTYGTCLNEDLNKMTDHNWIKNLKLCKIKIFDWGLNIHGARVFKHYFVWM